MDKRFFKVLILGVSLLGTTAMPVFSQGLAGPYLAANRALEHGSFDAAARYYVRAMAADPTNVRLKQSAMVSFVAAGDFRSAAGIAQLMRANDQADVFVDLVALTDFADKGDFESATLAITPNQDFLSPLLWGLLDAWVKIGSDDIKAGMKAFDEMSKNDALKIYARYHKALALAYLGDFEAAAEILGGNGDGPLHLNRDSVAIHVEILSELGRNDEALQVLDDAIARGFRDEQLLALRKDVALGNLPSFTQVDAPAYGMAEAFVTLADALNRGEPDRTALFYSRLALQLRPDFVDASLLVAELLELEDQFNLAEEAYGLIPAGSPSFKAAEIGRAEALRAGGDTSGATEILVALADSFPDDVLVLNALGDIYRGVENFEASVDAYTKAIANVDEFGSQHWVLFYTRGIGYEQLGDWSAAEKDLRRALELSPNQPFVLNYLGYSYIEMGIKFDEAQQMIETAVAGMPSNGYITDSLGWVLYRVGKFDEAVAPMERAVELLPVDPIVNDHLGDVLWMVGRKLEAEFQWRRAISFDPMPEDLERIKRKLEVGLDAVLEDEVAN